jgi:glycosyltransferase involved in cell wall biosynthesis
MTRVALTFYGDSSARSAWSGTPRSLADALEGVGLRVEHVSAEPPLPRRLVERLRGRLGRDGDGAEIATATLRRRLRRAGQLDAVVQIGTDYVVAHDAPLATFEDMTVAQARRLEHPLLAGIADADLDDWTQRQRTAYERATACCVTSRWAADSIVDDYGVPRSRVHIVGLGRNLDPRPLARDWSRPRYLFVGQDWERKNGPAVVAAFGEVRRHVPEATLTIVGGRPPVSEAGVLVHDPLYLNRDGDRRRLEQLFESATCLVLPSLIEPSAIVHLEAAAAGVPSIGTTVGGVRDLIGEGGRLVSPDDRDALVAAMAELADGDTAAKLGAVARSHAEWFTWPKTAERIASAVGLETGDRA